MTDSDEELPFPDDDGFVCPYCGEPVKDEDEVCAECKSVMEDFNED